MGVGTRTHDMPAARAASIPISVSSNTKQFLGSTPNRSAAVRKQSGADLQTVWLAIKPVTGPSK